MTPRTVRASRRDLTWARFTPGAVGYRSRMQRSFPVRVLQAIVVGYVVLAAFTRAREAAGAYACACDPDCWCKSPGLSLFRWVFPRGHRNHALEVWKRAQFEQHTD